MMHALIEGTVVMLLALAAGRLCVDPKRRASLWLLALLVQPLVLLTAAAGLEWQPWVVSTEVTAAATATLDITASPSPFALLAYAYAAGLLWRALPWLRSLLWARRIVATAATPRPSHWQSVNATLAARRRAPRLRVHAQVGAPFLTGALRPTICIPEALEFCDADRARHVLLHEHAHWRAHDWWRAQSVELVACLLWFHPVVHLLRARFRADLELACDARVLEAGANARDYAHTLLELSREETNASAMALGMATKRSQLVERVACLMGPAPTRKQRRRWPLAVLGAIALAACTINPLPRMVYVLTEPPPFVIEAAAPLVEAVLSPVATIRVDPAPLDHNVATHAATAAGAVAPRSKPASATRDAAKADATMQMPQPAATSTAQLYRSLAQVAREDVPWPTAERTTSLALDAGIDPRFEEGLRKGRLERDQRIARNIDRAFMITGNIPLKPTIEIQPNGGGVKLRISE